MKIFLLFALAIGMYCTIFGARVLFQKGFVEKLRETTWKPGNGILKTDYGYKTDKYSRGLYYLVGGIGVIIIAIISILKLYNVF